MASTFWNFASRFGRPANKAPSSRQESPAGDNNNSPTTLEQSSRSNLSTPVSPQPPRSPTLPEPAAQSRSASNMSSHPPGRRMPFFFREENSGLIVKGNFMTLAAKPEHVEKGEWLAHQVVEQYRLLEGMIKLIQEPDSRTKQPICNPGVCPTMSAAEFTYTWLDSERRPIKIPAQQYIFLVQKWILGKINDQRIFPQGNSGPSDEAIKNPTKDWVGKMSGFPSSFEHDVKTVYRQMFRCYAHLYHGHWLEPFYHLSAYKELNTCFIHFVNVGKLFNLLDDKDLKPMQPLVEIWTASKLLPATQPELANSVPSTPAA
ncbi:MAG: hypothetical protein Q9162_003605 [Coniocarpon cinnabarinum]